MDYDQHEDFKMQRQKLVLNIRRQNRQAHFNKKRNQSYDNNSLQVDVDTTGQQANKKILIADESRRQILEKQFLNLCSFIKEKYFPHMFPDLVHLLHSEDIQEKHHGIIGIRKILSLNENPPIHLAFSHNILPYIIDYMKQNTYMHLKLEATWIVSNIATGGPEQVSTLLDYKIIPILISFLIENITGIADQAIWAVGNLAGDSPSVRDQLISLGGVDAVIHFINNTTSKCNMIQAAWALSNLCRGTPLPAYQNIQKAVPVLCKVIKMNILDDQNLSDCLWALSYSIEGPKIRINKLLQSNALQSIIQKSKSNHLPIASPALRILGTVSTGNQQQTQHLLDHKILDVFQDLLDSKKSLVRREVCWILSNIAAGTRNQVEQLLSRENIIKKVLSLFQLDSAEIKRQICYIFANITFLGDKHKVKTLLVKKQVLKYYGQCLIQQSNHKLIENCLDTLLMLFDYGQRMKNSPEDQNFVILSFLSHPGVPEAFEQLQQAQSQTIYQKALRIYEKYFDVDNQ